MPAKSDRVYDYFKNEGYEVHGKFKDYVDAMWTQNSINEESRFKRLLDIYMSSVLIGLKLGKRLDDDKSEDKRNIPLEQISHEYKKLKTLMQIVLLVDESRGLTVEERFHEAFDETPKDEEVYRRNMELFNSYSRAGIEYMYNKLVLRPTDIDDDLREFHVANMMALLEDPINELMM